MSLSPLSRASRSMPPSMDRPPGRLTFMDLPLETQQQIVGHMSRKDLFVFQRLSPQCFSLASAVIYRELDLILTNSGFDDNGNPSTHAADALQTILVSEHNYGQHIKNFRLRVIDDNLDIHRGPRNSLDPLLFTRLLWDSKSDSSKFLNTALLLMTRRASIMETFNWDVPIELSGAVYRALHKIKSLRHLRVRLDVSPSPKMVIRQGINPNPHPPIGLQQQQGLASPPQFMPPPTGMATSSTGSYPCQTGTKLNDIKRKKTAIKGGYDYWANPRLFSGFKHLKTLALMRISNLECLSEVAECLKASSTTLKCLTLTLSAELARKARKSAPINPESDSASDTELENDEDELLNETVGNPTSAHQQLPATNEADIRKEKFAQESILARVFDLQSVAAEGKKIEKNLSLSGVHNSPEPDSEVITRKVNTLMKSLVDAPVASDAGPHAAAARLSHFKIIREVADLYITSQNVQNTIQKDHTKSPAPSTKFGPSSKPLFPLPTVSKQLGTTATSALPPAPSPAWNADSSVTKGATNPSSGVPGSSSTKSESQKPYAPIDIWPSNSKPTYGHNNASTATTNNNVGSNGVSKLFASAAPSAQQVEQLKVQQAQDQALMSSFDIAPYVNALMPSNAHPLYPSNCSSSPGIHNANQQYSTYPPTSGNPEHSIEELYFGNSNDLHFPTLNGASDISKKAKIKSQKAKGPDNVKCTSSANSDGEPESQIKTPSVSKQPFFAADPHSEFPEDTMDIDMEHPDEETQDLGEDQETIPEGQEVDIPTPRKRAKFENPEGSLIPTNKGISLSAGTEDADAAEVISPDNAMEAYVRTAHGLQLESLSLEWVPLKASIVARALDMSVLKRLTLLEVGPQDTFWTLLHRLQNASSEISLKSIHIDNVSLPFLRFLTTFEGLEELFMHERSTKQAEDPPVGPLISVTMIRKLALRKHAKNLKRLMIRNDRNDSWDVDSRTLQFLAVKGTNLKELGVSLNMKTYHVLMQSFAAFKKLYALHLITLRSGDRTTQFQNESLSFAVDNLSHCLSMKITYIAIGNSVIALESRPEHLRRRITRAMDRRRDKKGKGKGRVASDSIRSLVEQWDDSDSDEVEEALAETMAGGSKLTIPASFADVHDVKIFSNQMRAGKL